MTVNQKFRGLTFRKPDPTIFVVSLCSLKYAMIDWIVSTPGCAARSSYRVFLVSSYARSSYSTWSESPSLSHLQLATYTTDRDGDHCCASFRTRRSMEESTHSIQIRVYSMSNLEFLSRLHSLVCRRNLVPGETDETSGDDKRHLIKNTDADDDFPSWNVLLRV